MPVVSVVMPVYNAERFLAQAIESILNQTFTDFEFIIIDDGSTDSSPLILDAFQKQDARIHVHTHSQNRGLSPALNLGCQNATGTFIARMDADDISMPTRFEKQVAFLNEHLNVGVVGSNIRTIDESGTILEQSDVPLLPVHLSWELLFNSVLAHPSVMFRVSSFFTVGYYRLERFPAEDYDLWTRLDKVTQLANIPDTLLYYRTWSQSVMGQFQSSEEVQATIIAQSNIQSVLGEELPSNIVGHLRSTFGNWHGIVPTDVVSINQTVSALERILCTFINLNPQLQSVESELIRHTVSKQMFRLAKYSLRYSLPTFIVIMLKAIQYSPYSLVKVFVKETGKLAKRLFVMD